MVIPISRDPRVLPALPRLILVSLIITGAVSPDSRVLGAPEKVDRRLSFENLHTGETMDVVYYRDGDYLPDALKRIDHILRDWRTGDVRKIDTDLLDFLFDLREITHTQAPYQIISAYRTRRTNEMLRSTRTGVAKRSQHLEGKAIDVRLADVDSRKLRDAAIGLKRGGVGYYSNSDFVHIDTGHVRTW